MRLQGLAEEVGTASPQSSMLTAIGAWWSRRSRWSKALIVIMTIGAISMAVLDVAPWLARPGPLQVTSQEVSRAYEGLASYIDSLTYEENLRWRETWQRMTPVERTEALARWRGRARCCSSEIQMTAAR